MVDILAAPQQARTDSALRTLTGISVAHWVSHFHIFVLPMLFPFLKQQLGVGYVELGFALTVFAVVSGLTQAPIGYLADHIGARKILLVGLTVGGCALIGLGLHLSYTSLIVCAVLLGLANSVYHPADYAILSAHMDEARMGRAFSIHTFAGFLGGAVAPAIIAALVASIGGHGALIVAGAVGPLVALFLIVLGIPDAGANKTKAKDDTAAKASVITPALMVLTAFFTLLSLSTSGINNFGVVALMGGYGASFSTANIALTAFLGASAIGRTPHGFVQNAVAIRDYLACVAEDRLAIVKGYAFTDDDRFRADIIERVMCDMAVDLSQIALSHGRDPQTAIVDRRRLESLIADGAITVDDGRVFVSHGAEFLVRSVAAAFDAHLARSVATHSRAV